MVAWIAAALPPWPQLAGQLVVGLINGAFYALLSLGLAVIFGLLNIINFAHGAFYMLGAFCAYLLLDRLGIGYWPALILAPAIAALVGMAIERLFLRRIYRLDTLYGLLLTFGLALVIQGVFQRLYGSSGLPYTIPGALQGALDLGFMYLPTYRAWVIAASIVVCAATWYLIERTRLGSYLRAATENPALVQAFCINVPRMITLTYGLGIGLAALAGVLAAPIKQVSPLMGSDVIIVVFAIVVIGGMGSIVGAVVSGFALGVIEGLTKVFYPEASTTVIFVIMVIVLLVKPSGLFGRAAEAPAPGDGAGTGILRPLPARATLALTAGLTLLAIAAPSFIYPVFVMKALCFALFACAFNLLIGYTGLLSFGHAAFFGGAAYVCAYAVKVWGVPPLVGIVIATAAAAGLGAVFGAIAIRRQGIYFAMVTLALAQMIYFYAVETRFTGGEDGIQAVPRGSLFGLVDLNDPYAMYYFVLAIFLAGMFVIYRTVNSPFGQVLKAIRENEPRAISLGYRTERYKLLAFVLSAALSGLAGATKSLVFQLASLTDVDWSTSGNVVLMTLIGGLGTVFGPAVGAFITQGMEQYLAPYGAWVTVIQGAIFVTCVLTLRRGVVGELLALVQRRASAPPA